MGPFSPVYVNAGLTLDFIEDAGPFPVEHFCFRVSEAEFDAILEPEGHQWEMLTASYARRPASQARI